MALFGFLPPSLVTVLLISSLFTGSSLAENYEEDDYDDQEVAETGTIDKSIIDTDNVGPFGLLPCLDLGTSVINLNRCCSFLAGPLDVSNVQKCCLGQGTNCNYNSNYCCNYLQMACLPDPILSDIFTCQKADTYTPRIAPVDKSYALEYLQAGKTAYGQTQPRGQIVNPVNYPTYQAPTDQSIYGNNGHHPYSQGSVYPTQTSARYVSTLGQGAANNGSYVGANGYPSGNMGSSPASNPGQNAYANNGQGGGGSSMNTPQNYPLSNLTTSPNNPNPYNYTIQPNSKYQGRGTYVGNGQGGSGGPNPPAANAQSYQSSNLTSQPNNPISYGYGFQQYNSINGQYTNGNGGQAGFMSSNAPANNPQTSPTSYSYNQRSYGNSVQPNSNTFGQNIYSNNEQISYGSQPTPYNSPANQQYNNQPPQSNPYPQQPSSPSSPGNPMSSTTPLPSSLPTPSTTQSPPTSTEPGNSGEQPSSGEGRNSKESSSDRRRSIQKPRTVILELPLEKLLNRHLQKKISQRNQNGK